MTLLARLWRWLTRAAPTHCHRCGTRLREHPDGGAGPFCAQCDGQDR